jgi:hypothetical protein
MKQFLIENGVPFEDDFIKLPPWCKRIKIDIGLSDCAIHSKIWLGKDKNMFNDLVVFGFEPSPENIKRLKDPLIVDKKKIDPALIGKNFFLIPCAIGNVGPNEVLPTADLYITPKPTECTIVHQGSLHHTGAEDSDSDSDSEEKKTSKKGINIPAVYTKKLSVPIWSLNHFLQYIPFGRGIIPPIIDYVKIDCCGSELDVLHGAQRYLNKIAIMTVSPSDKYNIIYFLEKNNFIEYRHGDNSLPKPYESFSILPTYFNKALIGAIQSRFITYYQIGLLGEN